MTEDEILKQLKSVINHYGFPTPEMTPRFKSLLQDVFVDNPREMNLLIAGLEEGLPGQLQAKKGMVPYEILSGQMIDRLYNTRGMDRSASEWVVRTWAEAIEYDVPALSPQTTMQKKSEPVNSLPIQERIQPEIISKAPEVKYVPHKIQPSQQGNTKGTMIALGIVGLGILAVIIFLALASGGNAHSSSSYSPSGNSYTTKPTTTVQDADAWFNKGIALRNLGKYYEAIEAYDQALKIDPEYGSAWTGKAILLTDLGKYDEAREAWHQALKLDRKLKTEV